MNIPILIEECKLAVILICLQKRGNVSDIPLFLGKNYHFLHRILYFIQLLLLLLIRKYKLSHLHTLYQGIKSKRFIDLGPVVQTILKFVKDSLSLILNIKSSVLRLTVEKNVSFNIFSSTVFEENIKVLSQSCRHWRRRQQWRQRAKTLTFSSTLVITEGITKRETHTSRAGNPQNFFDIVMLLFQLRIF